MRLVFHHTTPHKVAVQNSAFTRTDLLVSVASAGIMLSLAAAAFSDTGSSVGTARCLNNLGALTRAWQEFEADHGFLPPNPEDGNTTPGKNWVPGQAGRAGPQEFDADILADTNRSLLSPYLSDATVFRCPEDLRIGIYQGNDPAKAGTIVPAARSYAMNVAVGSDPYAAQPGIPSNAPWLNNVHSHKRFQQWRTYGKFEDIIDPSPSNLAVLIDEDEFSINDGTFAFGMTFAEWIDWPGARHDQGAALSFADGHAELYRWVDSRTFVTNGNVKRLMVPGSPDYARLRSHISAPYPTPKSIVALQSTPLRPAKVKIAWPVTGTNYHAEFSDDLTTWVPLSPATVTRGEAGVLDPSPSSSERRFYRLKEQ